MSQLHTDLSSVPVSVAPSPATSGTTVGVLDSNAAFLPNVYPWYAVMKPSGVAPSRSNAEIVKVTGGSSAGGTTTYTIVRASGIPATSARTVLVGDDIYDANSAALAVGLDSWAVLGDTLTFSSNDGHTFVVSTTIDWSGVLQKGDRIKFTNNSVTFYGIITAISSSTITIYGGLDNAVANLAITNPFYSHVKSPYGMNLDPARWSETQSASGTAQASPVQNTWYNLGGSLAIPIGAWKVFFMGTMYAQKAATTSVGISSTLSTGAATESDIYWSSYAVQGGASGTITSGGSFSKQGQLNLASKTTYFANARTQTASVATIALQDADSGTQRVTILAVCAYL